MEHSPTPRASREHGEYGMSREGRSASLGDAPSRQSPRFNREKYLIAIEALGMLVAQPMRAAMQVPWPQSPLTPRRDESRQRS